MKETADILVPLRGVVRDKRNRSLVFKVAIKELIDNSYDAAAKTVSIFSEPSGNLVISDDGVGFEDLAKSVIIGESSKQNKVGRYGVGLKDAVIKYSRQTIIQSNGKQITANWEEILEGSSDGQNIPIEKSDIKIGSVITLVGFSELYKPLKFDEADISKTYYPIIKEGNFNILLNGKLVETNLLPGFIKVVKKNFTWRGRRVQLKGGTFKGSDQNGKTWRGYNPYYMGRLIGSGGITNRGVGDSICTNFSFMVHLFDDEKSWTLNTNKDGVEELDDLLEHIYTTFTCDLLEEASRQAEDIELREIEADINEMFLGRSRNQTRGAADTPKKGTIEPTGKGKAKKRTFTDTGDGQYESAKGRRKKFKFKFDELGHSGAGDAQLIGKTVVVIANLSNGWISSNKTNKEAMFLWAMTVYQTHCATLSASADLFPQDFMNQIFKDTGEELQVANNSKG